MTTEQIRLEIASMSLEDRASIADFVLQTLNSLNPAVEAKWIELADRRLDEMETGKVKSVPADEVFANIRRQFE